jgi:phage FluMu protein Com
MSEALIARWDGFLKNIKERFDQIMQESRDGCAQLFAESNYDPIPMGNAWSAMERRAKELSTKIDETWRQQVEPKFEEANVARPIIAQQSQKGDAMRDWMELEIEKTRIGIYCKCARDVAEVEARERQGGVPCKQCGAPLAVPHTFRVINVPCAHCRTINEYEPGTRTRYTEASCLHSLCQESAWSEYVAMHEAERAYKRARPSTLQHIQTWEAAQIAYHRKYLTTRLQYLPDQAPSFAKDLAGRMEHFYVYGVQNEAAWIQAGRPRAAL